MDNYTLLANRRPAAVLFDYGHTLALETAFDALAGYRALMPHFSKNPLGVTAEELTSRNGEMFGYLMDNAFPAEIELSHRIFFRTLFESLRLESELPMLQLELIYWNAACPIEPMPGAVEILDWLSEKNIPTGVVSNMSFSGEALHERIRSILPDEKFEFVMSSSDYGWRKPNRFLFEAAIARLAMPAEKILFCGDSSSADVTGSANAGMIPAWIRSPIVRPFQDPAQSIRPEVGHICVSDLHELRELLEEVLG